MTDNETLYCIVEIPKGSRNKFEFDSELQSIKLDRFLFSSVVYPTDYGYFPDTLAPDGDPLDAMVAVTEATFSGCYIECRVLGVFRMHDEKGQDDKILCVPSHDPNWSDHRTLEDLSEQMRDEIEHFFSNYKKPEGIDVRVEGWRGRDEALAVIKESRERWDGSAEAHEPGNK